MNSIINAIENKTLGIGDKLPSINQLCSEKLLKRDTIMYAFNELRSKGIISGMQGKGYYVASTEVRLSDRYFILFDSLNDFSGAVYNALVAAMPAKSVTDIFFHYHRDSRIKEILDQKNGEYSSYIIDYKGLENYDTLLAKLPSLRTCLIGKPENGLAKNSSVFFEPDNDIYEALRTLRRPLKKYCRLVYLSAKEKFNKGYEEGFARFCHQEKTDYLICHNPESLRPALYEAYFVHDETVLIKLLRQIRKSDLTVGENLGIVTFGDSPLKEITLGGLTAIKHDFEELSNQILGITRGEKRGQFRVRSKVIQRNSL